MIIFFVGFLACLFVRTASVYTFNMFSFSPLTFHRFSRPICDVEPIWIYLSNVKFDSNEIILMNFVLNHNCLKSFIKFAFYEP